MTTEEKSALRERWNDMTSFMSETVKEKWWDKIIKQYSDRPFYNLTHLHNMLQLFDQHKDRLHDRYAVAFAIFFKHLEYDSRSTETAKLSADQFKKFCSETTFDQEGYVVNLILESENNCTDANLNIGTYGNDDIHYLIDFDMMVHGESPEKYEIYKSKLRQEYSYLNEKEYKKERVKVLKLFLQIPNIYATKEFRDKYEEQARKNISEEIISLGE
uniref:Inhibitor_I29 domain-containing protein n=1 Tax=Strongyloides papillosus TaxID=174720 RepID=A0A0N5B271_STREA